MPPQTPQEQQVPIQEAPLTTPTLETTQPQTNVTPQPAVDTTPPTKKRIPKWLKIAGIVLLVFIGILVVAGIVATNATKAAQKVSDEFVNDVQSGNSNAAYELTSKTFQQATTKGQLAQLISQVGPALQGQEKVTGRTIAKSTGVPETAVLVYDVKTSSGTKYMKLELQKNGNVWQVINFRSSDTSLNTTVE